jgi:glyoxylase-like metal-dependent hydrolase (beta-lactamase superfamily II)
MLRIDDVVRVPLGRFVRPPEETGTGQPRVETVLGYLVRHDDGAILLDTGMGAADPETEEWYRPDRIALPEALRRKGFGLDDIDLVVNCHLHFDHCGGNPLLAGTPIVVQRRELETARGGDYTFPELVDHDGVRYDEIDGEAEVRPGVLVVPTPGHTDGHQSVVVLCADGTVVLAGQSHDHTSDFAADVLAAQAQRDGLAPPLPLAPAWVDRLLDLDPRRVLFAHDASVWEPATD